MYSIKYLSYAVEKFDVLYLPVYTLASLIWAAKARNDDCKATYPPIVEVSNSLVTRIVNLWKITLRWKICNSRGSLLVITLRS